MLYHNLVSPKVLSGGRSRFIHNTDSIAININTPNINNKFPKVELKRRFEFMETNNSPSIHIIRIKQVYIGKLIQSIVNSLIIDSISYFSLIQPKT